MEDVNALSDTSGALHCGNLTSVIPTEASGPVMSTLASLVVRGRAARARAATTPTA